MKNLIPLLSALFFICIYHTSSAQLTFSGEIRPRAEYRHGFKTLAQKGQDAAFFVDQRTRFNFKLQQKNIETFVSLQDIRVWGDQPQLVRTEGASTGLHQAWAKVKFNKLWSMKIGRQEIAYDDHRIMGNVGWAQQARSHDAAIFSFQDSTFKVDVGLAFNQDKPQLKTTVYTVPNNYKTIQYIWLNKQFANVNTSVLFLNNGLQSENLDGEFNTVFSQTIGGRLTWKADKITSHIAAYYQSGKMPNGNETKISAYYLSADISYPIVENVSMALGVEVLSGNDQMNPNDKNNAFTPFYGTNHKFNGVMDYFYVGNHVGSVGLNDFYLKTKYKKQAFYLGLDIHFFQANQTIIDDLNSGMDKYLGTELDLNLGFNIKKGAKFKLGYAQLFASDSMGQLKGGDPNETNNWMYAMLIIKPSIVIKR